MKNGLRAAAGVLSLVASVALVVGCGQGEKGQAGATNKDTHKQVADKGDHKHTDWWCKEHGIPEAECSACSKTVADEFKAKGDWCDKHNRAMSQCFICKPERQAFYAAKYKAKYGKDAPPLEEEKEEDKKENK